MRHSPSLSVACTSLWMICLRCVMLFVRDLDFFPRQSKGCTGKNATSKISEINNEYQVFFASKKPMQKVKMI